MKTYLRQVEVLRRRRFLFPPVLCFDNLVFHGKRRHQLSEFVGEMERLGEERDLFFPSSCVIWSIACRSHHTGQHQNQDDKEKGGFLLKNSHFLFPIQLSTCSYFVYFFKSSQSGHHIGQIKRKEVGNIWSNGYKSIRGKSVRKRNQRDKGFRCLYTIYIYTHIF